MTCKDYIAIASILRKHNEELQYVDSENAKKHGVNYENNAIPFSNLVSQFCFFLKADNSNFNSQRFRDAIYGDDDDDLS